MTCSASISRTWARGRNAMYESLVVTGPSARMARLATVIRDSRAETMLEWVMTTPFGTPVEPEVYIMMAVSSGSGEAKEYRKKWNT